MKGQVTSVPVPALSPEERAWNMSQLYDLRLRIEDKIKTAGLDAADIKGKLALRSGKLLSLISPNAPEDPLVLAKLKKAAKEVLNLDL